MPLSISKEGVLSKYIKSTGKILISSMEILSLLVVHKTKLV